MTDRPLREIKLGPHPEPKPPADTELRSFLHVLYRALKMITSYLEKTYGF